MQVYSEGTLVLMRNCAREGKKGDKMKARWLGPYKVHKVLEKGLYQLCNQKTSTILKKLVNQCRLTVFNTMESCDTDTESTTHFHPDSESSATTSEEVGEVKDEEEGEKEEEGKEENKEDRKEEEEKEETGEEEKPSSKKIVKVECSGGKHVFYTGQ